MELKKCNIEESSAMEVKWNDPIDGRTKQLLRIEHDGRIVWTLRGKKIEITDKRLLGIAFLDSVIKMSGIKYDYSLLDKDLYKDYQKFLASGK